MDRTEKLKYEKGIEKYFDDHKVYDLLEKLFKDLIVNRPENPIDYMIERLKTKPTKRIFITGYGGPAKKSIALGLSNSLGYNCLSMDDLIQREISKKMENSAQMQKNVDENLLIDDATVIELVRNQIIKYEEDNASYIIDGFPSNLTQSIFLQQIGLLPDNVVILKTSRDKEEKRIYDKLREKYQKPAEKGEKPAEKEEDHSVESHTNEDNSRSDEQIKLMAKRAIEEKELNIQAVQNVFAGFCSVIPIDQFGSEAEATNELAKLLKFKDKTHSARCAPRIVLVTPPCSNKNLIVSKIAKNLQIIPVDILELLKKEIAAKNENSKHILESLRKNQLVNDKYVLKLLEDRLYRSDCMVNGWILTGFPKSNLQINFMENMKPEIKPSLTVVVDMDEKLIYEKAEKIKFDPKTGLLYSEDSEKYKTLKPDVLARLKSRTKDEKTILKERIDNWKKINEVLLKKDCLSLNGEEKDEKLAQLVVNAVGYNS